MIDSVGYNPSPGFFIQASVAHIYIPKEVDRNQFVETCMRKGICSIVRENSYGCINNVRIDNELIQRINWPTETGKLGSTVVVVLDSFKKVYNVVAILNGDGDIGIAKEGQRIFHKETDKGTVTVTLDANRPVFQVLVENGDAEIISRGGKVNIISDNEVAVKSPKIGHNEANEPMLRGQKVVDLIDELITLLFNARTATSIGLQPLNNFVQINELKSKLEELKSTKSFLE
jgi:hypothetical protein